MQDKLIMTFLLLFLCSSLYGDPLDDMEGIKPKTIKKAPSFSLVDINGNTKSLSDFKNKVIVLNFWASWCVPCKVEMPSMEKAWLRYRINGLVIIGISVDQGNRDDVKKFLEKNNITFPILLDPKGFVRNSYEIRYLPTTYIIGRNGKFIGKIVGSREWISDKGINLFKKLLEEKD